ncbi:MAG: NERD domain-containing protein [Fibrobacteraceae bacterium]|nr:NERD domain-containing protein [Fibrobacteraceae bacterium]
MITLLWCFIVVLTVVILFAKVFQNQIVGFIGEKFTANRINLITGGRVFTDIYAEGDGNVVQIDMIAVTNKGILVVEKKTMIGLILGDAYQKYWTICLNRGRVKHQLRNPLHQNYGHIKVLESLFPPFSQYYNNVVVFGNNAKLGDKLPNNVVTDRSFREYYRNLSGSMSEPLQSDFCQRLLSLKSYRRELKVKHKMKIRKCK